MQKLVTIHLTNPRAHVLVSKSLLICHAIQYLEVEI